MLTRNSPRHKQRNQDVGRKDYKEEEPADEVPAEVGVVRLLVSVKSVGGNEECGKPSRNGDGNGDEDPSHGTLLAGSPSLYNQLSDTDCVLSSIFWKEWW